MNRVLFGLSILTLCLFFGCSSCPKVQGFKELQPQVYATPKVQLALPANYSLEKESEEGSISSAEWKGPRGIVRLQIQPKPEDFDTFRKAFLRGVYSGYRGVPTRTLPLEKDWREGKILGNQLEVLLKPRYLAVDYYFLLEDEILYLVSFQRAKEPNGDIDPVFLEVENLLWESLCIKTGN